METAESADDGLARLREEHFDLVAIDHHMPGKTGRQMLDEIVALPDHPAVVFVTGNDDTAIAVEAIHAGASDFVVKTVGEGFFDLLAERFRQAWSRTRLEREKREAEAQLRSANERLELLLREVHHRVSNSLQIVLSFVSIQANQADSEEAKDVLAATQNRIRAISKVHQNLYTRDDISTIDLDEYLDTLVCELRASLAEGPSAIELNLSAEHVEVSPDEAVSVGVVVNELVSNAAKYAFPEGGAGAISVDLSRDGDDGYAITVGDDGAGMGKSAKPSGSGLGMRIIDAMTRGLGATLEQVPCDTGTCQRISVNSKR